MRIIKLSLVAAATISFATPAISGETINAGSGSYTTAFPGVDKAGRNAVPRDCDYLTGNAVGRPIPTNDWWSPKLLSASPDNMFNYPMGIKTLSSGLDLQLTLPGQATAADVGMLVGLRGLNAVPKVSDYSDWTVTFDWDDGMRHMNAVVGIGMPMAYFTRTGGSDVTLSFMGHATVSDNILIVTSGYNKARYAAYAPKGATWRVNGTTATTDLAGKDYWTVALLPDSGDAATIAARWAGNAFAFPSGTCADWQYAPSTGTVTTTYSVTVDHKEGNGAPLMGLLPHQWANITGPVAFDDASYSTVRGEMKMLCADSFTTSLKFHGIIPTLPNVLKDDPDFSISRLKALVNEVIEDNGLDPWTDSYNDGQLLNRLVQTARIADEAGLGDESGRLRTLIRERLENWLTYTPGEVAFLFYYHKPYGTLLGYPAGHGQDGNINDHHFHWGYLIGAAAYLAQHDASWKARWAPMIDLLVRDAASADRNDPLFPYQRAFSPYAGHCWANGFGTSGPGNDQESTSEAMQFHTNLLHWAEVTGNTRLRDQAVYMYVSEVSAADEYWFDKKHRNFASTYGHFIASRVFTNGYDYENFWGGGAAGSLGIEIYPMHAGSFYLMNDPRWAKRYWDTMTTETGILSKQDNPNIWYDTWWKYLAMIDADKAISLYNDYQGRTLKFGVSQAHTYQWLHAMRTLGRPNQSLTSTLPTAVAFDTRDKRTYVAQNYTGEAVEVKFSDGFAMNVPAFTLATATGVNPDEWIDLNDPEDPEDPENPENPGDGSCSYVSTVGSQGTTFNGPYTITFTTRGNSVEVLAKFEGVYTGLVPAYLWNYTDGFTETQMSPVAGESQVYSATISDCTTSTPVRVAVKIAYAGGMSVTDEFSYTLGQNCTPSGIDASAAADIRLITGEGYITAEAPGRAVMTAYGIDGRSMAVIPFVDSCTLITSPWPRGVYVVTVTAADGASRTFSITR